MSRRAWIHVCLMIALAFNGVAAAHASAAMALKANAAHAAETQQKPGASTTPPCHQTQAPQPAVLAHDAGCCDRQGCDCDCMQASPALVSTLFQRASTLAQSLNAWPRALSHAQAALPQLTRPPISRLV